MRKGSFPIFALAYVLVFLFPVLTAADAFFLYYQLIPIPIRFPSLLLLVAILIPIVIKNFFGNGTPNLKKIYRNTLWISVPFLLVGLVSLVWGLHPAANWEFGIKFILRDLYSWLLFMISLTIASSNVIRKHLRTIIFIILSGASLSVVADFFAPEMFFNSSHRAAGFYFNPNEGALSLVFLAIAAINWKKRDFFSPIILVLVGLVIFTTLSVGGLAFYTIVLCTYIFLKREEKGKFLRKLAIVGVFIILILLIAKPVVMEIVNSSSRFDNETAKLRIDDIFNMSTGNFAFAKEHSRLQLVFDYIDIINVAPLVGQGTGFTRTIISGGSHNMYLKHWVENGLLGLLAYLTLIGCAFRYFMKLKDLRGMLFIFIFFSAGFVDHNLLYNKTFVVLLGIFGALAYLENSKVYYTLPPRNLPAFNQIK